MRKLFQYIKDKFKTIFNKETEADETNYINETKDNEAPINTNVLNLSITKPSKFEDVLVVCDKLSNGEVVCVNINYVEDGTQQRIVDFLAGFCFTVDASFNIATKHIFMLIPENFKEETFETRENSTAQIV